ncbi:FtsH protease activity modulator HflK [Polynucleobacter sp. IMCC 30228]|nr:FtsH protease activity modulator HflK [Polynucleobacter sp. IMCC 30228]
MMHKLLALFSVKDPGWGNSSNSNDAKDSGNGEATPAGETKPPAAEGSPGNSPENIPTVSPQPPSKPPERPTDGPPDLDELWRDFNNRLNNFFGGKKGPKSTTNNSGNSSPNKAPFNKPSNNGGGGKNQAPFNFNFTNPFSSKASFGFIAAGAVLFWLLSGFFIIQEGQAGVILTFGKYSYTAGPGINWRMPWPIQAQEIVNLSGVRSVEVGRPVLIKSTNLKDASMLTEDENIIDVKFAVQYRLKNPTDYLFNNRNPDIAVTQAAETAIREIVGRSKMDTVLYEGREKIAIDLAISIQKILDSYKTGIYITSVTVQNVQPPEQVQAAFDDAVKASQDAERLKSEGQAYANDIIPRAKGTGARLLQEAEGYKARVIATADGDATRFKQILTEYAKAPQVTRDRMYIDTMKEVYSNVTKILVDTTKSNSLLYLPLDKIAAQVSAESAQAAAAAPNSSMGSGSVGSSTGVPSLPATGSVTVSPAQPASGSAATGGSNSSVDKRDGLRSRDRDAR